MSDTPYIPYLPPNPAHETIIGCVFLAAILVLVLLTAFYSRLIIARHVLGPPDSINVINHKLSHADMYERPHGLRWMHENAPTPKGPNTISDLSDLAKITGFLPEWMGPGVADPRHPALRMGTAVPIGTALTTDESVVSPVDASNSLPRRTVGFAKGGGRVRTYERGTRPKAAIPLMPYERVEEGRPPIRKLSKKSPLDESGRRNKKSVSPGELPESWLEHRTAAQNETTDGARLS